jgi:protein-disulfide isomerase
VFKDMPLTIHTLARPAHEAARCAGAAGKYWAYHDRLFDAQPEFEREDLIAYAVDVGLEREPFARCLEERRYAGAVDADIAEARAAGVTGTPTFFIGSQILVGAHPIETFRAVIEEALRRRAAAG